MRVLYAVLTKTERDRVLIVPSPYPDGRRGRHDWRVILHQFPWRDVAVLFQHVGGVQACLAYHTPRAFRLHPEPHGWPWRFTRVQLDDGRPGIQIHAGPYEADYVDTLCDRLVTLIDMDESPVGTVRYAVFE
jgi:hypothetical protein